MQGAMQKQRGVAVTVFSDSFWLLMCDKERGRKISLAEWWQCIFSFKFLLLLAYLHFFLSFFLTAISVDSVVLQMVLWRNWALHCLALISGLRSALSYTHYQSIVSIVLQISFFVSCLETNIFDFLLMNAAYKPLKSQRTIVDIALVHKEAWRLVKSW